MHGLSSFSPPHTVQACRLCGHVAAVLQRCVLYCPLTPNACDPAVPLSSTTSWLVTNQWPVHGLDQLQCNIVASVVFHTPLTHPSPHFMPCLQLTSLQLKSSGVASAGGTADGGAAAAGGLVGVGSEMLAALEKRLSDRQARFEGALMQVSRQQGCAC
jgi:hypothetical protein